MINLEEILEMWKKDSVLDPFDLGEGSIATARIHAKYLELLSVTKLQMKRKEMQQKVLLKDKWLYFTGVMTKDEMDERGWDYDPFKGGRKPLKSDLGYFYEADADLQKSQATIDYIKSVIETLESIMTHITWRHQTIGNAIKWRQLESGS
jgi:hypothetical protein